MQGKPSRLAVAAASLALLAATAAPARAQGQALEPRMASSELAQALAHGGYVMLWRHTSTDEFVPQPGGFDVADCATQRNLSERGRQQAALAGRAFEKLGIRFGRVFSSPYCRCVDTGTLALGHVETDERLSTGDELTPEEKSERAKKIRAMLDTPPAPGTNTVLITHTANLLYSFGLRVQPEGIAHVFRPSVAGLAAYMGFVLPDEWPRLAGIREEP